MIVTTLFLLVWSAAVLVGCGVEQEPPSVQGDVPASDLRDVEPDLIVPPLSEGKAAAGKRVRQVLPAYAETEVYHTLYLPEGWSAKGRYPVIVEYAGNGGYRGRFGDRCSGRVEGSKLGYGIAGGEGHLWVCLPFLDAKGESNALRWWGDAPEYDAASTVAYCKQALNWICANYGGDPEAIVLVGFSRGALACNYIGLHDEEIAALWRGFVAFSHYDGVSERWPYPNADRRSAKERLTRLAGRPQFLCAETSADKLGLEATRTYLEACGIDGDWTFHSTGFRNHDDAWVLRPSPARAALRAWLKKTLEASDDGR